jgi:hypothetical protein
MRRRASTQDLPSSSPSNQEFPVAELSRTRRSGADDSSRLSSAELSGLNLSAPYPWAKTVPAALVPSEEDQAVSQFFEKYVMYPCNHASSPGFLEHLPCLFEEVKTEGRVALRWAVYAAAYASLSNDQDSEALGDKSLQCYGQALSALAEALADPTRSPDDYTLMTVVILDLFEVRWQEMWPLFFFFFSFDAG